MDPNTFPTKGNLIAAKNSLGLAYMGYGLMDKKRNILIRELMELIDDKNNGENTEGWDLYNTEKNKRYGL